MKDEQPYEREPEEYGEDDQSDDATDLRVEWENDEDERGGRNQREAEDKRKWKYLLKIGDEIAEFQNLVVGDVAGVDCGDAGVDCDGYHR